MSRPTPHRYARDWPSHPERKLTKQTIMNAAAQRLFRVSVPRLRPTHYHHSGGSALSATQLTRRRHIEA